MNELLRRDPDAINVPPFGTEGFRRNLTSLLNTPFVDPSGARPVVGNYRWGVYAFVGYDERVAIIYGRIKPGFAALRGEPSLAYALPPTA